jgi:actin
MIGMDTRQHYVGDEAISKRGVLNIRYPIVRGMIENWDDMELTYDFLFEEELMINTNEHPMLFTEPPNNVRANREKLTQLMFEKYSAPGIYLSIQGVLALYSTGNLTGCVLDCGEGLTSAVPVYDGYAISHAMQRMNLSGCDVTDNLMNILTERGHSFTTAAEREIVREIKEQCGYVALDYEEEFGIDDQIDKNYQLPDGSEISISNERFRCAEVLFQPSLILKELPGIPECIYQTIMQCDIDARRDFYRSIVLTGGSTSFPGFAERVHKEMKRLVPSTMTVEINAAPERKYSVWIGGSILASLSTFQAMWISRAEYDEYGVNIIHRKCN